MKSLLLIMIFSLTAAAANVGGQLKNAQLENKTSDYASGVRGRVWFRTDLGLVRYDDGSTIREFLSTNQVQTVTAKDIDGGTASNTSRLTLPKASTATLNGLTRKQATVVYDTTENEPKFDDGSILNSFILPAGVILPFGGSAAPNGYFLGDGSAKSRTTYAKLFAAVGTAFGVGDGSTTFNIPNCARRVFVGAGGAGSGTLANTVGATGGTEEETISQAQLPAHTHSAGTYVIDSSGSAHIHSVTDPGHAHSYTISSGAGSPGFENSGDASVGGTGFIASAVTNISIPSGGSHGHGMSGSSGSVGSGTAVNNLQPSLVVNCIVKY